VIDIVLEFAVGVGACPEAPEVGAVVTPDSVGREDVGLALVERKFLGACLPRSSVLHCPSLAVAWCPNFGLLRDFGGSSWLVPKRVLSFSKDRVRAVWLSLSFATCMSTLTTYDKLVLALRVLRSQERAKSARFRRTPMR
jgi:hypothetical protein